MANKLKKSNVALILSGFLACLFIFLGYSGLFVSLASALFIALALASGLCAVFLLVRNVSAQNTKLAVQARNQEKILSGIRYQTEDLRYVPKTVGNLRADFAGLLSLAEDQKILTQKVAGLAEEIQAQQLLAQQVAELVSRVNDQKQLIQSIADLAADVKDQRQLVQVVADLAAEIQNQQALTRKVADLSSAVSHQRRISQSIADLKVAIEQQGDLPHQIAELTNTIQKQNPLTIEAFTQVMETRPIAAPQTAELPAPKSRRTLQDLNVAMICDEFTYNSYAQEFNVLPLEPETWLEVFEQNDIDFFFCESAWSGVDSVRRPWNNKIFRAVGKEENRTELLAILEYCKKKGIPTVFWNKEDPVHYSDAKRQFPQTAQLFDYVFTSDVACVDRYRKDFGLTNVDVLEFATQAKIYNPLGAGAIDQRSDEVLFAGSWYKNHRRRSLDTELIFDDLLERGYPIKILDRSSNLKVPNRRWPKKYMPFVQDGVSHKDLALEFKKHKYGININTVTDSKTMFSRRVFELASSNVGVISNWSQGIADIYGDKVLFPDKDAQALELLGTPEFAQRIHEAMLLTLNEHTYTHRAIKIVQALGIDVELPSQEIGLVQYLDGVDDLTALKKQRELLGDRIGEHAIVVDSDLTLQDSLADMVANGTQLLSTEDVKKHRADLLLKTSYVLPVKASTPVDLTALDEARAHLMYASAPVSVQKATGRFEIARAESLFGSVISAGALRERAGLENLPAEVYFI